MLGVTPLAALVRGVDGAGGVWTLLAVGVAYQCTVCWLLVRRFLAGAE